LEAIVINSGRNPLHIFVALPVIAPGNSMAADAPAKRGLTGKAVETQVKRPRGRPYKFLGQLPIDFFKTRRCKRRFSVSQIILPKMKPKGISPEDVRYKLGFNFTTTQLTPCP